ncbi:MAG: 50S ribosomal protein L35ae [Nanoarchaeota archaeon]|nr:50S ribosomal protein L35ae [Nanoarchaeota archaeon]MBU0963147.1 50S ribosomal protein L35ae [Nanoarchaeota archaeon]
MEAVVINYRRGKHRQNTNQMILKISGVDSKEKASKLITKRVVWKSPAGKELIGEIKAVHGNNGALRAYFSIGLPGQSIGTKVKVE